MMKDKTREIYFTRQEVNRKYRVLIHTGRKIERASGEVVFVEMSGQLPFCALHYQTIIFPLSVSSLCISDLSASCSTIYFFDAKSCFKKNKIAEKLISKLCSNPFNVYYKQKYVWCRRNSF